MKKILIPALFALSFSAQALVITPSTDIEMETLSDSDKQIAGALYGDIKNFDRSISGSVHQFVLNMLSEETMTYGAINHQIKNLQKLVKDARSLDLIDQAAIDTKTAKLMGMIGYENQDFTEADIDLKHVIEYLKVNVADFLIALIDIFSTLNTQYKDNYPTIVKASLEF